MPQTTRLDLDSLNWQSPTAKINQITVEGFKSLAVSWQVEVRPLTLLAGANSSGKSSLLQPLLLLKQTLESTYDPGPLKMDGPNVSFTSGQQMISRGVNDLTSFSFGISSEEASLSLVCSASSAGAIQIDSMDCRHKDTRVQIRNGDSVEAIAQRMSARPDVESVWMKSLRGNEARVEFKRAIPRLVGSATAILLDAVLQSNLQPSLQAITDLIHVPGLRGNPTRTYRRSGGGPKFPGCFEDYTATVLYDWKRGSTSAVHSVSSALRSLNLTWKVDVNELDQTQLEVRVGRLTKPTQGGARDLVNIADVGFGVSQVLPVLVALQVAAPGQLVYIEQPELHLHPRAQGAMASVLADAARRGVHVVAETHSQELLLGVQTLVAEGSLNPSLVKLHWFERGADGFSKVTSADLDESGAFGDWPVDFADVSMETQNRYLDAAEAKLAARAN